MNLKTDIEELLESLKTVGYSRRRIEEEMGNAPFHIDQVIARGGNKGYLKRLQAYADRILRNATHVPAILREPKTAYSAPVGDVKDKLIQALERENSHLREQLGAILEDLKRVEVLNHAILQANQRALAEVLAKSQRKSVLEVADKLDSWTREVWQELQNKGISDPGGKVRA